MMIMIGKKNLRTRVQNEQITIIKNKRSKVEYKDFFKDDLTPKIFRDFI